jgi:hypothetical protein
LGPESARYCLSGRLLARRARGQGIFLLLLIVLGGTLSRNWVPWILFGVASVGAALLCKRGHLVTVHEKGLNVRSLWIGRQVTWSQIERVHYHELPFRFLTLTTSPGTPVVYFPLEFDHLDSIREAIAHCAGPNHPLVKGIAQTIQRST